jgi:hypothetical protein
VRFVKSFVCCDLSKVFGGFELARSMARLRYGRFMSRLFRTLTCSTRRATLLLLCWVMVASTGCRAAELALAVVRWDVQWAPWFIAAGVLGGLSDAGAPDR